MFEKNNLLPVSIANHFQPRLNPTDTAYNLRPRPTPTYSFRLVSVQENRLKAKKCSGMIFPTISNIVAHFIRLNNSIDYFYQIARLFDNTCIFSPLFYTSFRVLCSFTACILR